MSGFEADVFAIVRAGVLGHAAELIQGVDS